MREMVTEEQRRAAEQVRINLGRKLRSLREQRGMSQAKLAQMADMVQPMVNRFETGERKITVDHAMKLAPLLGVMPAELLPPNLDIRVAPRTSAPASPAAHDVMPILGADGAPIDETPVPPVLATARERYALYMSDSTMSPRYAAGTLLQVAPHKPAAPGRGVVLALKDGRRLVREWVDSDSTILQVRRYGADPAVESYGPDEVSAVHVVVGTVEA